MSTPDNDASVALSGLNEIPPKPLAQDVADYFAIRERIRHATRMLTPFYSRLQAGSIDGQLLLLVDRELRSAQDLIACMNTRKRGS